MYCPVCGATNTEGAKFCGACGARMGDRAATADPAGVTAPTGPLHAAPQQTKVPPPQLDGSMGSLPARRSGRTAVIAIVLAIDVALVIGGIVLATSPRGGEAGEEAVAVGTGTDQPPPRVPGDARDPESPVPSLGSGRGTGTVIVRPGTAIDAGAGDPGIDARSLDDRLPDAAVVTVPDVIDAARAEVVVDAAAAAPDPIVDAASVDPGPDADLEGEVSAVEIMSQLNHLIVQSNSKLDRCYQSATKALPDDQPLSGQVDIGLTVLPTGKTTSVRMSRDTINSPALLRCVITVVEDWTFSRHDVANGINLLPTFTFGPNR